MARHKVEICGVNTANIKVLSNEEMKNLFEKMKSGDEKAREELINGNLKLVLSILKKYNNRTDNMDDLFQIGTVGLIKAINNFDLSYDVKFSTYAVPMILGEVKRYLRDSNSIRVARSVKDLAYRILKAKEELTSKNEKEPTIKQLAQLLNVSEYEICNAIEFQIDKTNQIKWKYTLNRLFNNKTKGIENALYNEQLNELFNYIINKIEKEYKLYCNLLPVLKSYISTNTLNDISINNKEKIILELFKLFWKV